MFQLDKPILNFIIVKYMGVPLHDIIFFYDLGNFYSRRGAQERFDSKHY